MMLPAWIRTIPLWAAVFAAFSGAMAADSVALSEARAALAKLAEKQAAAKTISLRFEARADGPDGEPLPAVRGSLLAGDSGRFRLEHGQGVAVSDGKTLWQYFPESRQVIVRDAGEAASGAGGILLRYLRAAPLRAERTPGGLRAALDPAATGENLDSLVVLLDRVGEVRGVETQDAAGRRTAYAVKSLRLGVRTRPKDFAAPEAPGAEVVDMR